MTAIARLLEQRSIGHVRLRMERHGIAVLQESGSAKCRLPRGPHEAILINTSGGLAGGDTVRIDAEAGEGAKLTLTTQAAERVYRTLGPRANVDVRLKIGNGATLLWLPLETIFFDGSALGRKLDIELEADASFLAVEPMVFGRRETGEVVKSVSVSDRWSVRRAGKLMHAEAFRLGPDWPASAASMSDHLATATVALFSSQAEDMLDRVRSLLGPDDGASAWNGKLLARFSAKDGFTLKKRLIPVLTLCADATGLPKSWTF